MGKLPNQLEQYAVGEFTSGAPRVRLGVEEKVLKPYPVERVVLLGMGYSLWDYIHQSYGKPPARDGKTEVWTLNYAGWVFKSDLCFNMHDFDDQSHEGIFENYLNYPELRVMSIRSYDRFPNVWEYPMQEVVEDELANGLYFTNSTAYAIAFALACRVKHLEIFGCDFDYNPQIIDTGDRFEKGRACLEYWLGVAQARGMEIGIGAHCTLLNMNNVAEQGRVSFYGYGGYKPLLGYENNVGVLTGWEQPSSAEVILEQGSDLGAVLRGEENGDRPPLVENVFVHPSSLSIDNSTVKESIPEAAE